MWGFVLVIIIGSLCIGMGAPPVVGVVIGVVGCFIAVFWSANRELKKDKKEIEKVRVEYQEKEKRLQETLRNGTWEFPAAKLYEKCASVVKKADNEFELEKLRIAARLIMEEENASQYFNAYCSDAKLKAYFLSAQKQKKAEKDAELDEIREAKLNDEEKYLLEMSKAVANMTGREKRVTMLEHSHTRVTRRMAAIYKAEEAARQLGTHIYSAGYQKPKNWGTAAGIADALAGPGAGVATAMSIQAENAKIEAQNKALLEKTVSSVNGVTMSLSSQWSDLEKEQKILEKEIDIAQMLVVPNVKQNSKEFLAQCVSVGEFKVNHLENRDGTKRDALLLKGNVSVDYSKIESLSLERYTIDGVLKAKITCGRKTLDTVFIPFPLYGLPIKKNGKALAEGICNKYTKRGNYKVVPEIHNLWLVEK